MELNSTRKSIDNVRKNVIGLYRRFGVRHQYEMVLKEEPESFNTVVFTQFGAIQENFGTPKNKGQYALFPEGKNFTEMLEDPFEFANFLKENFDPKL